MSHTLFEPIKDGIPIREIAVQNLIDEGVTSLAHRQLPFLAEGDVDGVIQHVLQLAQRRAVNRHTRPGREPHDTLIVHTSESTA